MLKRLTQAGLAVNREKCEFCCSQIKWLDNEGIRPDSASVESVQNFPAPKNVKQMGRILGMLSWSRFIERESELKVPLVRLLRKEQKWE